MNRRLLFVGAILLAGALAVMAADSISGKWKYEQPGRAGGSPTVITLDLKVAGGVVTGTMLQPGRGGAEATPVEIKNGKVTGDSFSFDVVREGMGGPQTTKYEGVAAGGELKLKITRPGRDGTPTTTEVIAKRA
jgi:hypothetical protein